MNLEQHIKDVCKSVFYYIQNISKIRDCLTQNDTETLVHAFISSKLVTQTGKYEHITPVLMDLHWLPVEQHMKYKILLLTYKPLNGMAP